MQDVYIVSSLSDLDPDVIPVSYVRRWPVILLLIDRWRDLFK